MMVPVAAFIALTLSAASPADLPERWRDWLDHQVRVIIAKEERDYFLTLATDAERERFEQAFWLARDPTPGTRRNEYREEYERRLSYADYNFGRDGTVPGSRSDRGRMYVLFGEPQERRQFTTSAAGLYPCELWFYQAPKNAGLPPFFYLLFYKRHGAGDYVLYSPLRDGPQALLGGALNAIDRYQALSRLNQVDGELYRASLSLDPGGGADYASGNASISSEILVSKIENLPNTASDVRYLDKLRGEVTTRISFSEFDLQPLLLPTVDAGGIGWVHYEARVPPSALALVEGGRGLVGTLELYLEARDEQGRALLAASEQFDINLSREEAKVATQADLALQGCFALVPGAYRLTLLVRNPLTGQFGTGEGTVKVPDRSAPEGLELVATLLAFRAEPVGGRDRRALSPFQVGDLLYFPARDVRFVRGEEPWLHAQARYPKGTGRPGRLAKTITVLRGDAEVYGYLGFLEPSPAFDGGVLTVAEKLRIGEEPAGDYEIVLRLQSPEGAVLAESRQRLVLVTSPVPRTWTLARAADRDTARVELSRQFRQRGEPQRAAAELEAWAQESSQATDDLEAVRLLLEMSQGERANRIVVPLADGPDPPPLALVLAAASHALLGQFEPAAAYYEKAVAASGPQPLLLNALGEAYARLGRKEEAARAFERSLEVSPEQPKVRQALAGLGG